MQSLLSCVIIDSDRSSRSEIERFLAQGGNPVRIVGSVADFGSGARMVQSAPASVVILEAADLDQGVADIRQIHALFPQAVIFVTAAEKNPDWILGCLRAGATEYLVRPVDGAELQDALQKARKSIAAKPGVPQKEGQIISVYNPIGGMGTTTIAVNLAAALADKSDKVALVDLNLFSGDVATFLDVNPKYTLSSVTANLNRLDTSFLMSSMTRHASGMYILGEPLEVEETLSITGEQIQGVLSFLKRTFTHVVIDSSGQLQGGNMVIFKSSDCILFNTVLSLPALKNARRYLTAMEKQGLGREKVKLVVNRYSAKADIRVADAEKILDTKVFRTIPNDYPEVIASINKGIPVVKLSPRSSVSTSIVGLAEAFAPAKQKRQEPSFSLGSLIPIRA